MLPYEPLLKIVHTKIKCYTRKTKKTTKSGKIHNYNSKQYVISLKQDQPFSCEENVTIIRSENYFRMNNLIKEKRKDKKEFLEIIFKLESEIKDLKEKLEYYDNLDVDIKMIKLKRLEKEIEIRNEKLDNAKKTINSQKARIEDLTDNGILEKINRFLPGKNNSEK
ncbi:hypothetical protein [Methanobacterium alcaliphilum]|uniref:hypothetical protein n=1 Tax=Methanobacterium alcaliphilum TaxID=392018 RepID=UPI00200A488D|nr:hypothetical protein [Methanobacterium alcaliphilum]MCK9151568.1 hypothetical protein [Methanobacterium alcaliphilum]